jgi:hypothetical protein
VSGKVPGWACGRLVHGAAGKGTHSCGDRDLTGLRLACSKVSDIDVGQCCTERCHDDSTDARLVGTFDLQWQ